MGKDYEWRTHITIGVLMINHASIVAVGICVHLPVLWRPLEDFEGAGNCDDEKSGTDRSLEYPRVLSIVDNDQRSR